MEKEVKFKNGIYPIHNKAHTKVWSAWQKMKSRCYNIKNPKYPIYGAAGRFVCAGLQKFINFYNILGDPPTEKHSLDRGDNSGNYTCGECEECNGNMYSLNVRWATPKEQSRNVSTNTIIVYKGHKMCLSNACELAGLPYKTIWSRINNCHWDVDTALSTPLGSPHSYKKIKYAHT